MATKFLGLYDLDISDGDETYLGLNSSGIVKRFPKPEGSLGKTSLTANTTYFVNVTTGSNANDGKTSGTAWQTFAYALEWLGRNIDLAGWTLELKLADGVHDGFSTNGDQHAWITGGYFWIHGNDANPENVILRGTTWEAFGCGPGATFFISDMKVESTATMVLISIGTMILGRPAMGGYGGRLLIGRSQGAAWAWLLSAYENGSIADLTSGGIEIDTAGISCAGIASAYHGGLIYLNAPIRINANLTALDAVFKATQNGVIEMFGVPTLADGVTVTGKKYDLHTGGQIRRNLNTQSLDQLPGTVDGTIRDNIREKLSADRTYYLRPDGSNNNTGRSNNSADAWLTPDFAREWIARNIDFNNFRITVEVADGTYPGVSSGIPLIGGGFLWFKGNHTTPANVIFDGTNLTCGFESWGNNYNDTSIYISGMTCKSAYSACVSTSGGRVYLGAPDFTGSVILHSAASFSYLLTVFGGPQAYIGFQSPNTIVSVDTAVTPVQGLMQATDRAKISQWNTTFTNVPNWGTAGVDVRSGAIVDLTGSFTGSATGKKFAVSGGGFLRRADLTTIPGSVDGTWDVTGATNLRIAATAATTFYVNAATGSDTTGNGTSGLPWATPAKAIAEAGKIDGNGQTLTIDLADGSYGAVFGDGQQIRGWSSILFDGNATTPSAVQITAYSPFYNGIRVTVQGMTFAPGAGWIALEASHGARVTVTDCALGVCTYGFLAQGDSRIHVTGGTYTFTLTGNLSYVFYADTGGTAVMGAFCYINAGVTVDQWFYVARGGVYTRGLGGSSFLRAGSAAATGGRGVIGSGGIVAHEVNTYPDPGVSGPTYAADATGIYNDEIKNWRSYNLGTVGSADYERLSSGWSSNVFKLSTGALGTGVARDIALNAGESASANVLLQTGGATRFSQSRRSLVLTPDESLSTTNFGLKLSHTWNAAGINHTAFQIESTITAGNVTSYFVDFRKTTDRAGASTFSADAAGNIVLGRGHDTAIDKHLHIYRFWDGGSNWEGSMVGFYGSQYEIMTHANGTGVASAIYLRPNSVDAMTVAQGGVTITPIASTATTHIGLKLSHTWNAAATTHTAFQIEATLTAGNSQSLFASWRKTADRAGAGTFAFQSDGALNIGLGHNTASDKAITIYRFWDGGSNLEGGRIGFNGGVFEIATTAGGTGSAGSIYMRTGVTNVATLNPTSVVLSPNTATLVGNNALSITQTWNNAAVAFTGIKANFTSTAASFDSKVIDLQVGGFSKFAVRKDSAVFIGSEDSGFPRTVLQAQGSATATTLAFSNGAESEYITLQALRYRANNLAAITADAPTLELAQTWNNAGVNFSASRINITNTASAPSSNFVDYQVGGASKFMVGKDGGPRIGLGDTVANDKVMEMWRIGGANAEGIYIGYDSGQFGLNTVAFGTGTVSPLNFKVNSALKMRLEAGGPVLVPSSAHVPTNNGELVFQATSNTTLTVKFKGSDGVVRSATLTLT